MKMLRLTTNREFHTFVSKVRQLRVVPQKTMSCGVFYKPLLISGTLPIITNQFSFLVQKRYFSSNHAQYMKIELVTRLNIIYSLKNKKPKKERPNKIIQMNQFSVALIGRTNVGKSTLFNRLVGRKEAIVSRTEGTTRDRREGQGKISGLEFTLIDTGGYVTNYKNITEY